MKRTLVHFCLPALLVVAPALLVAACGPTVSGSDDDDSSGDDDDDDDDDNGPDAGAGCVSEFPEECTNGEDDDCDLDVDCDDEDCAGVGECPESNCGELDLTEGEPLALPDNNSGSTTAACQAVTGVEQYTSSINFTGFSDGQVLEAGTDILGICVNMEHTWLHDLQIEMTCPSGALVVLDQFRGVGSGGPLFMGIPNDADAQDPVPGTGWDYCWTPTATQQMLDWGSVGTLPAGDYASSCPISNFVGCPLNGNWTIKVTDLWADDNGFIFSWGIKFDPNIVEDCDEWPPIP